MFANIWDLQTADLEHCQKRLEVVEDEVYSLRKRVEDLKKELATREDEVNTLFREIFLIVLLFNTYSKIIWYR